MARNRNRNGMMTLGKVCALLGLMELSLLGGERSVETGAAVVSWSLNPGAENECGQEGSMRMVWNRQLNDVKDVPQLSAHCNRFWI